MLPLDPAVPEPLPVVAVELPVVALGPDDVEVLLPLEPEGPPPGCGPSSEPQPGPIVVASKIAEPVQNPTPQILVIKAHLLEIGKTVLLHGRRWRHS